MALAAPNNPLSPSPDVAKVKGKLQSREGGLEPALQQIDTELQSAGEQHIDRLKHIEGEREGLKPPEYKPLPEPKPQLTEPHQVWGSLAMAMAVMAGAKTRSHLTSALNAAAGTLQGYAKKDQAQFDQDYERFKVANENALKAHEFEMQAYRDILQSYDRREALEDKDYGQKEREIMARFAATARAFQNDTALAIAEGRISLGEQTFALNVQKFMEKSEKDAAQMAAMEGKVAKSKAEADAWRQLGADPEYQHASPIEKLAMARRAGIELGPKEQMGLVNGYMKQITGTNEYKNFTKNRAAYATLDGIGTKIDKGERLTQSEQAALQDFGTRLLTGGVPRQFTLKLTQQHGDWQDRVQQAMQTMKGGGFLSPKQAKGLFDVVKSVRDEEMSALSNAARSVAETARKHGVVDDPEEVIPPDLRDIVHVDGEPDHSPSRGSAPSGMAAIRGVLGDVKLSSPSYRDPVANAKAGGSPTSAHQEPGTAFDFHAPAGMSTAQAAEKLAADFKARGIPFDQIIDEGDIVHVGFHDLQGRQRGEVMKADKGGKNAHVTATAKGDGKKQYAKGDIVTANGKRYRVIGGDPSDPDVEEVR